jgi:hypothetical protein
MLKPKEEQDESSEPLSVTMVNNRPLPSYSSERFYMLSEIQNSAHSTLFLSDHYHDDDHTTETVPSSEGGSHAEQHAAELLSPYALLYILWRPDMPSSPRALTYGLIRESVQQLKSLMEYDSRDCNIYLVVDCLATVRGEQGQPAPDSDEESIHSLYQSQVIVAELLARSVAQCRELRDQLQGFTIGISNHVRAAPGLEACMESIVWGSRDRRKIRDCRSTVGIVALHPDDLVGLQNELETDAAQGVLQSLTCAEWNGNGDLMSFAKRAHIQWCTTNMVTLEEEVAPKRQKVMPRRIQYLEEDHGIIADPITIFLVILIASWFYIHVVTSYEDGFEGFFNYMQSMLAWPDGREGRRVDSL